MTGLNKHILTTLFITAKTWFVVGATINRCLQFGISCRWFNCHNDINPFDVSTEGQGSLTTLNVCNQSLTLSHFNDQRIELFVLLLQVFLHGSLVPLADAHEGLLGLGRPPYAVRGEAHHALVLHYPLRSIRRYVNCVKVKF